MPASRIVLITGAAGGLGSATTATFVRTGHQVIAVGRSNRLEALYDAFPDLRNIADRLTFMTADVTDEESVRQLMARVIDQYGRLDVLVNSAGGYAGGKTVVDTESATWEHMITLNLRSTFLCSKYAAQPMIRQRWGRIINIASRAATERAGRAAAYGVAKRGVVALTEAQAEELKEYGITVNALLPSIIDTPTNRLAMPHADFTRWPKAEQIARVILFLASDDAEIINGAAIPVYGLA
jgi:NAD(P)-dependent dehydrogenase (short-subunit alcohol dehydrogenase family)